MSVAIQLFLGDLLRVGADAICTSTNPWLSLQAGSGGAVRLFGSHSIQEACDALLAAQEQRTGRRYFATGTAHLTPAGTLPFKGIVHCVAIDAFHGSSEQVIASCVRSALALAERQAFAHLAMPVFATGNGRFDFAGALRTIQATVADHAGSIVEQVSIAVRDMARADEARRILSRDGWLRIASERDGQLIPWVSPYLQVLHGNHLGLRGAELDEFLAEARRALSEADEPGLRRLLWESNWRPRLVAAWLAGILRQTRLEPLIAELLLESEVTYAGQGYCFALMRFGGPSAAAALVRYLERWLPRTDCPYDQDWALAALDSIDAGRARSYLVSGGAWERFEWSSRLNFAGARQTLEAMRDFVEEYLTAR